MGKIKGWSKIGNGWHLDGTETYIGLDTYDGSFKGYERLGFWKIYIINPTKYSKLLQGFSIDDPTIAWGFKTKKQATDYAMKYMRGHPHG